jgi:hypothetical protein
MFAGRLRADTGFANGNDNGRRNDLYLISNIAERVAEVAE